jgi:tight adherence protein B
MDTLYYAAIVLLFIAVALCVELAWQWWFSSQSSSALRTRKRLKFVETGNKSDGGSASLLKSRRLAESASTEAFLTRIYGIDFLDRTLLQSGCKWTVAGLLVNTSICFLLGLLISLMLQPLFLLAIAVGLACSVMPLIYVMRKRSKRLEKIENQLPEVADLIARSLRAGHAFPSTVQMVADEMPEPIAGEFRMVSDEVNYGVSMSEALQRLAARIPLTDLRYMVVAVLIQRESGGNLAELMTNISYLIRERLKLLGQIRTLSAEGRLSAWILGLLPVVICLVLGLINPGYFNLLIEDPDGMRLIIAAGCMMFAGALWMRKIIHIHI